MREELENYIMNLPGIENVEYSIIDNSLYLFDVDYKMYRFRFVVNINDNIRISKEKIKRKYENIMSKIKLVEYYMEGE